MQNLLPKLSLDLKSKILRGRKREAAGGSGREREGARRAADDGERGFLLVVLVAGVAADDRR